MRRRSSAALTLLGWYLLIPSPEMAASHRADSPLSDWYHVGAYDSKERCGNMIWYYLKQANNDSERWRYSEAQCVDSDDPRMRGK
jgi:hypothetical protein